MSDLRAAAQQLLHASDQGHDTRQALQDLRAALAQQEQEPCKRHNPCERLPDGYCARCHSEMYP